MAKVNYIQGIDIDASRNSEFLYDLTADQWVRGVQDTLDYLYTSSPCATSRAILDGITESGKTVTIIPSHLRGMGPDKINANAGALPVDFRKATAKGKPTEDHDPRRGEGGGSDSTLEFVAQDWERLGSPSISFKA